MALSLYETSSETFPVFVALRQDADTGNNYIKVIMQEKIRLYLEYVQNASFWYDVKLIFLTFWTIVIEKKLNNHEI